MQREHLQPLRHTGPASIAGARQGFQTHPHALGAGGPALSVSQPVSVQDLRMASQSATGFQPPQTQRYAGTPQNARPGPSGHPNPGQNVQNVTQGYYRNAQAAPGPVRSNSTPHAQYAPYPQPQYNNGYAQVITGHGHYSAPSANHAQPLAHDSLRASMPSLNAGQSQTQQVSPMQISQSSNPSNRQNVPAGSSSMPQAPEPPWPHPHPERNPPAMISLEPAPASAPAPQFPQTPQASAPSQPRNALPTPPATSAGPSNAPPPPAQDAVAMLLQSANQQARSILEPMRDSIADSLSAVHIAFTQELSRAHAMFVKSETKAVQAQCQLADLRDELTRVYAERDRALERCERMKKEREAALEDMRKMNENLPKLVVEHYQLKADHDALRQEIVALRETNAQLREKATLSLDAALQYRTQAVPRSLLQHSTDIPGVKLEFPAGADSAAVAQVKDEHVAMKEPSSPTDIDADVAFALVRDFKVRKQKQRDQADPEHERPHSISGQHPPSPSEAAAAAPSFTRVNLSPTNIPPTPPTDQSPWSRNISPKNALIAQRPPTDIPNGAQSLDHDADASTRGPKLEDVDGFQSGVLSSIPELSHVDVTGELDIIDLTFDCDMTESPAKLTSDLSPLSHRPPEGEPPEERKRTVEREWNERQETPNKRQRTEDEVEGPVTQDVMMADGDSQEELNEAFLRSLIEAAEAMTSQETSRPEADQITTTRAPVSLAVAPPCGDGQDTEPSPALGAEPRSKGSINQGDQLLEMGRAVPFTPRSVTNGVPVPPTGLLTPPSPSPTTIRPTIPRPARRSESGPQQAPIIAPPALTSSASVAPALSSTSVPTEVAQPPSVSVCPPPPSSAPAASPPPSSANPSPSSSGPPPLPPPTRSMSTTTRPLPPPLSVSTPSSSQGIPVLSSTSPSVLPPQEPPVTPVANAFAGINLSLPSPTNAVQLPTEIPVASPSKPEQPGKKLGINHIDLVYRRVGSGYYQCRFCERRHKEVPGCPSTKFASNAPGYILTEHVEKEHPLSVQPMLEMTPEDIRETKQRLESMDMDNASVPQKKRKSAG